MKHDEHIDIEKVPKVKAIKEPFIKEISHGEFNAATGLVEVTKMKGNFWRSYGFSKQGKNYCTYMFD